MIYLKINGKEVHAEAGMTILQVADANGIRIPRLCYHKSLFPIGACRLCVVEVKPGPPRPQPACTTPVADKMEVTTHSEQLDRYRRQLLQLALINHPLECPICDKGGECELQNLTRELKIGEQPFHAELLTPQFDDQSPLIERYSDRCVKCERCVRICRDWVGAAALYFDNRGYRTRVTAGGKKMDCEHCGSCVEVCPVGAIVDKTFRHSARSWQLDKKTVICPYCGGGCHLILNTKGDQLKRVTASFDEPVNSGVICSRGRFSMDYMNHPERLTQPLLRKDGALQPVEWEEAFDFVAERLRKVIEKYGADAVAGFGSARASNEGNYVFQKFMRLAVGTSHVDSISSLNHQQVIRALRDVLGRPQVKRADQSETGSQPIQEVSGFQLAIATLQDLREADTVLVLAADVKKEMPPFAWRINQAQQQKTLKHLAVVSSRRTRFRSAAQSNMYCRPGSAGFVLEGLLKALLQRDRSKQPRFGEFRGRKRLESHLENSDWKDLESSTRLRREDCQKLAEMLEQASKPVLLIGNDLSGLTGSYNIAQYLADLLLFLGRKLRVLIAAEKVNTQGCSDMGVAPDWLPGYLPLNRADRVASLWGKRPPQWAGMPLDEIMESAASSEGKRVRALWVMGNDLLNSLPDRERTEKALDNLDLLISQEVFLNPTAAKADCVFPALTLVEQEGSVTATDLRVQYQPGVPFVTGPKPDWEILREVSGRLGYPMSHADAGEIFSEISQLFANYDQYPLDEIPKAGFWWSRLYRAKYGSAGWRRKLDPTLEMTIPPLEEPPAANEKYPFLLFMGKSLFQSGTLSRYGRGAQELEPHGHVWLNPGDAERLQFSEDDRIKLTTEAGSLEAPLWLDHRVPQGVVQAAPHFPELAVGRLIRRGNLCPVRIDKA